MARYVILYFENNELAEDFVFNAKTLMPDKVKALVPAPTLFCEGLLGPEGDKHKGIKKDGFFRGKKYGWWVCSRCGKPKKAWGADYSAVISAGINLLDAPTHEERTIPEPPSGWDQNG